jgi:hypothetical protein
MDLKLHRMIDIIRKKRTAYETVLSTLFARYLCSYLIFVGKSFNFKSYWLERISLGRSATQRTCTLHFMIFESFCPLFIPVMILSMLLQRITCSLQDWLTPYLVCNCLHWPQEQRKRTHQRVLDFICQCKSFHFIIFFWKK